jgi:hypothetical protein
VIPENQDDSAPQHWPRQCPLWAKSGHGANKRTGRCPRSAFSVLCARYTSESIVRSMIMKLGKLRSCATLAATALILVVGVTGAMAAAAGNRGGGRPERGQSGQGTVDSIVGATFDAITAQAIRGHFQTNPAQTQGLPPGIARNLTRGKPLPPGIAKRFLPGDLRSRLPAYPGYEMLIADRNVLLVSVASGLITDILLDVL